MPGSTTTSPSKENFVTVKEHCHDTNHALQGLLDLSSNSTVVAECAAEKLKNQRQSIHSALLIPSQEQQLQQRRAFFRSAQSIDRDEEDVKGEDAAPSDGTNDIRDGYDDGELTYIQDVDSRVAACKAHFKNMEMFNNARRECVSLSAQCTTECESLCNEKTNVRDNMKDALTAFNTYIAGVEACATEETNRTKKLLDQTRTECDSQNTKFLKNSHQTFTHGAKDVAALEKELGKKLKERDHVLSDLTIPDRSVVDFFDDEAELDAADVEYDVVCAEKEHLDRAQSDLAHVSFHLHRELSSAKSIHVPTPLQQQQQQHQKQPHRVRQTPTTTPTAAVTRVSQSPTASSSSSSPFFISGASSLCASRRGFFSVICCLTIVAALTSALFLASPLTLSSLGPHSSSHILADKYRSFMLHYNNASDLNDFLQQYYHIDLPLLHHHGGGGGFFDDVSQRYTTGVHDAMSQFTSAATRARSFMTHQQGLLVEWFDAKIVLPTGHAVEWTQQTCKEYFSGATSAVQGKINSVHQMWSAVSTTTTTTYQSVFAAFADAYETASSSATIAFEKFAVSPCVSGRCSPQGMFSATHTITGVPLNNIPNPQPEEEQPVAQKEQQDSSAQYKDLYYIEDEPAAKTTSSYASVPLSWLTILS